MASMRRTLRRAAERAINPPLSGAARRRAERETWTTVHREHDHEHPEQPAEESKAARMIRWFRRMGKGLRG